MLAAGGAPGGVWVVPALSGPPACPPAVAAACPTAACGAVPGASTLPSPAALPAARSPEPPPSACPPLTAPVPPVVSPRFVTDRLRTTFAPRIGKPGQHACRAKTARAAHHTHSSFPRNDRRCSGQQGGRGHTLALQNGQGHIIIFRGAATGHSPVNQRDLPDVSYLTVSPGRDRAHLGAIR